VAAHRAQAGAAAAQAVAVAAEKYSPFFRCEPRERVAMHARGAHSFTGMRFLFCRARAVQQGRMAREAGRAPDSLNLLRRCDDKLDSNAGVSNRTGSLISAACGPPAYSRSFDCMRRRSRDRHGNVGDASERFANGFWVDTIGKPVMDFGCDSYPGSPMG
jgi:hypothetical protein